MATTQYVDNKMCNSYVWTRKCLFKRFGNLFLFFSSSFADTDTHIQWILPLNPFIGQRWSEQFWLCIQWEHIDVRTNKLYERLRPDRNGVNQMSRFGIAWCENQSAARKCPPSINRIAIVHQLSAIYWRIFTWEM